MTIYAKRPMQHACESKRENVRETSKRNSRKMWEILELPYPSHASEGYWRGKFAESQLTSLLLHMHLLLHLSVA